MQDVPLVLSDSTAALRNPALRRTESSKRIALARARVRLAVPLRPRMPHVSFALESTLHVVALATGLWGIALCL